MKKVISLATAAAVCLGVYAQDAPGNSQIHVFRNDKTFSTYKIADLQSMTFEGQEGEFVNFIITDNDGKVTSHPMSAVDSCVVRATGLPEFHVTLQDYPNWTELTGQKDDVHPATIYMVGNGMYDDLPEQTVEFRGRGNSTWSMPKKPYRFKMAKKASVCGLPKAKTFALIANYIDCTKMRNAIALWIARYFNMPFTNHCVPVKVYLNGNLKGTYMLTEKIGVGGGSVDIPEETGCLFELDTNYDENYKFKYGFRSGYSYKELPVMVKDPDFDELAADETITSITSAQEYFSKWQSDFTTMADAVTSRSSTESLSDVIDIDQAVNFFIVNGIVNNHEMKHPKSLYIHKKALGTEEKYIFGPVWDFDWAFTFDGVEGAAYNVPMVSADGDGGCGYSFLKLLFANQEFRTKYKERLEDFITNGYPQLKAFMEEYAMLIEPSVKEDGLLWPDNVYQSWCIVTSGYNFRENFATLKTWIENRLNYMQNHSNYGLYQ